MHPDTETYHAALLPGDREICELLAQEIAAVLPEAENKVWHGHPVWFLDGNPVVGYNKGGVLVEYGHLRGFIPASHIVGLPRNLNDDERNRRFEEMIGEELPVEVIEVERRRRRLVLSHRFADTLSDLMKAVLEFVIFQTIRQLSKLCGGKPVYCRHVHAGQV